MSPKRSRRKTQVLTVLVLAAVAVAVAAALFVRAQLDGDPVAAGSPESAGPAEPTGGSAVAATTSAPYTIEAEPSEVARDEPVATSGGWVQVVLTYMAFDEASGTVQANGFAAGVIENGGTCTLTLTQGDDTVRVTSEAMADATTTSCGLLETSGRPAAGTWDAVLTYESDDAHGRSEAMEVAVP